MSRTARNDAPGDDRRYATSDVARLEAVQDAAPRAAMAAAIVNSGDGGHLTTYPGGKNGAGIYQRLISLMPPHRVYVEAFLGSGAILRRKKPAAENVGIDEDAGVIAKHSDGGRRGFTFVRADARDWLQQRRNWRGDELIYCDPPYLGSVRHRPDRACYRHEMMTDDEHAELLRILTTLPAMVMISGYASALYEAHLGDWHRIAYPAMTRGGLKTEVCWMNYPPPHALHDYRFLGADFHDRCRITRKIRRWTRKLAALPALERAAILAALQLEGGSDGR